MARHLAFRGLALPMQAVAAEVLQVYRERNQLAGRVAEVQVVSTF